MYKLAIFDMDGTILNTIDDLADCVNVLCRKYGFPEHTVEEVKYMVGNGIPKLMRRALPADIDEDLFQKLLVEYIEYYCEPFGIIKYQYAVPTVHGIHLITSAFNTQKFGLKFPRIDVHKNNPTLLYYKLLD